MCAAPRLLCGVTPIRLPNENRKHCGFCSLTPDALIDDRLQRFAAYHDAIPHGMDHKPLWPHCVTENCPREDRLQHLQPITARHSADTPRFLQPITTGIWYTNAVCPGRIPSQANRHDRIIGSIPVVVKDIAGPGPSTRFPRRGVTARPNPPTSPCRPPRSEAIDRALHPSPSPVQYVGVHHRRADIPMPEQFLNRPDVVAILEQMGGE